MPTGPQTVGEDTAWVLLESRRSQLLLILAMCLYYSDRHNTGSGTGTCILEPADALVYENRTHRNDGYDDVVCDCHNYQRNISAALHGHNRPA